MLLNIDKPLRTSTLHMEDCPYVPKRYGTQFKPREQMGRDGGWFLVTTEADAKAVAEREFPRGTFVRCSNC